MKKKLFISKDKSELNWLTEFCESRNINLIAKSQIKFVSVPFEISGKFDVIFFSSIRAALFFIDQELIPDHVKIACIGQVTATKLKEIGLNPDFVGQKAGRPEEVALEFKEWIGERKVLIPCSSISNRSISSKLDDGQYEEVVVYTTENACKPIEECSVYIFTSPSNFKSFLACNSLHENSRIIAWGKTTYDAIKKTGHEVLHTLSYSDNKELLDYLAYSDLFHNER